MRLSSLLVCCVLSAPFLASAGSPAPGESRAHGACREDIKTYCGQVERGDGRIRQCIQEHSAKFSPACQAEMKQHRERAEAKVNACKSDAESLCAGIEPGGGRVARCLHEKEAQLSTGCREAMQHTRRRPVSAEPKS